MLVAGASRERERKRKRRGVRESVRRPKLTFLLPMKRFDTDLMTPGVSICCDLKFFIMSRNSLYIWGRSPNSILT